MIDYKMSMVRFRYKALEVLDTQRGLPLQDSLAHTLDNVSLAGRLLAIYLRRLDCERGLR